LAPLVLAPSKFGNALKALCLRFLLITFCFPFLLVEGKGPRCSEERLHPENTHAKALSWKLVGSLSTPGITEYQLIVMRFMQLQNWIRKGHIKIQDEGHSGHDNPESC
jgi:hypothetical protein